jgi:hypothetical protein
MKAADTKLAASLVAALEQLPKMRDQIGGKTEIDRYLCDRYALELASAEMSDDEGQGSDAYFYLETPLALRILDQVEQAIRDELKRLGVTP